MSRSQQRTIGAYGSKIVGIGRASGLAADSNEASGNSGHEVGQKQISNTVNNAEDPLKSTSDELTIGTKLVGKKYTEETRNNNGLLPATKNSNGNLRSPSENIHYGKADRPSGKTNLEASWSKTMRYENVHASNIDSSGKKWWRLLKWLPNLKSLKFSRRRSTIPEDRVFDEFGNCREELSMTMWNIHGDNDQRPLWDMTVFALRDIDWCHHIHISRGRQSNVPWTMSMNNDRHTIEDINALRWDRARVVERNDNSSSRLTPSSFEKFFGNEEDREDPDISKVTIRNAIDHGSFRKSMRESKWVIGKKKGGRGWRRSGGTWKASHASNRYP